MLNQQKSIDQQEDAAPSVTSPHHGTERGPNSVIPEPSLLGTLAQNRSFEIDVINPENDCEIDMDDLLPIDEAMDLSHECEMVDWTLLVCEGEENAAQLASAYGVINNISEMGFVGNNDWANVGNPETIHDEENEVASSSILQSRTLIPSPRHELAIGQEFSDAESCRGALRDMAIALHFEIKTIKSDKKRFTAKCASEGCPWRVHAAKLSGVPTFSIRTMNSEHTCKGISHLGHSQASIQWVADSVKRQLRENPDSKPKELQEQIHRTHGITLHYKQVWRGKERVMDMLRGSCEEDYRLLPQYCDQIRRTNPGSVALVSVNPMDNNAFQRLFVSYKASIDGFWNACRPLIWLDGTVLRNRYVGSMLYATGVDAQGELFPLAFCVVEEENEDSWLWFVSQLSKLHLEINSHDLPRLTILSDRKNMIVDAVEQCVPSAFHGFCVHQLIESFKKDFNDDAVLANLFWDAANALTITEFDRKMLELEAASSEAGLWVRQVPPHLWASSHFEGKKWCHIDVKMAEAMNSWMILEASALPIIHMMEEIRRKLMVCLAKRRITSREWSEAAMFLVPSAENRMVEVMILATDYTVRAREGGHEVVTCDDGGDNVYMVDIVKWSCTCGGWQLNGVPCSHAAATLSFCQLNAYEFVEDYFKVSSYQEGYSEIIYPILDRTQWEASGEDVDVVVNPPKSLSPPAAQPRKRRARKNDNQQVMKRALHCSRCNQPGHYRTTCTAPL